MLGGAVAGLAVQLMVISGKLCDFRFPERWLESKPPLPSCCASLSVLDVPRECRWQMGWQAKAGGLLRLLSPGLTAMILKAREPSGVGVGHKVRLSCLLPWGQPHGTCTGCPGSQSPCKAGVCIPHVKRGQQS